MANSGAREPKFIGGLPTIIRETLLQLPGSSPKAAFILDALYFHGVKHGVWMTEAQILVLLGVSRRLVYEGIRSVYFVRRKDPDHSGRGRPAYQYRIPSDLEVAFELELSGAMTIEKAAYSGRLRASSPQPNTNMSLHWSDGLYKEDLQTLKTYRIALHREFILPHQVEGIEMARGRLADRMGVSTRTSREYDKILKTRIVAQYERTELKAEDWRRIPRAVGEKRPQWLEIYKEGSFVPESVPYIKFMAWKHLKLGHKVVKVRRLFNRYYPHPSWPGYWQGREPIQVQTDDIWERAVDDSQALPY